MRLDKSPLVLIAGAVTVAACSGGVTDSVCTLEARPGISVDVRDSITNALVGRGSSVIVREGAAVVDSAYDTGASDGPYALAYERPGTYTVSVTKTGYQPWAKTGVQVVRNGCHVNAVPVIARLHK